MLVTLHKVEKNKRTGGEKKKQQKISLYQLHLLLISARPVEEESYYSTHSRLNINYYAEF